MRTLTSPTKTTLIREVSLPFGIVSLIVLLVLGVIGAESRQNLIISLKQINVTLSSLKIFGQTGSGSLIWWLTKMVLKSDKYPTKEQIKQKVYVHIFGIVQEKSIFKITL